jgi:hypothetical protein
MAHFEANSLKKKSQFIQAPSVILHKYRSKKSIFSVPTIEQNVQSLYTLANDNGYKNESDQSSCSKVSLKTSLPAKDKVAVGHFSKLKQKLRKNDDFERFIERRYKVKERKKLKSSIAKIQAKIDELSDVIHSRTLILTNRSNIASIKFIDRENFLRCLFLIGAITVYTIIFIFLSEGERIFKISSETNPQMAYSLFGISTQAKKKGLFENLLNFFRFER